jgi:hypothetical protein
MKKYLTNALDGVSRRLARSTSLQKRFDSFDILEVAFLKAAFDSSAYYERHLLRTRAFDNDLALLTHALKLAPSDGLVLEFGVASGRTISHMASMRVQTLFGFDSFEGLPEDWRSGYEKGYFAGNLPAVPDNVELIKGWFDLTLPDFLSSHDGKVSLVHIDCDLYSSTKTIFDCLESRLTEGSVLVFDEYWNYPGWREHEHKAFEELKTRIGLQFEPIGFVPSHQQVGFIARGSRI